MGICPKVALIQNESLAGQKSLLAVLFGCGFHGLCAGRGLQGHLWMAFDSSRSQGYVSQIPVFILFLFIIYVLWLNKNDSILILFSQSGVIQGGGGFLELVSLPDIDDQAHTRWHKDLLGHRITFCVHLFRQKEQWHCHFCLCFNKVTRHCVYTLNTQQYRL